MPTCLGCRPVWEADLPGKLTCLEADMYGRLTSLGGCRLGNKPVWEVVRICRSAPDSLSPNAKLVIDMLMCMHVGTWCAAYCVSMCCSRKMNVLSNHSRFCRSLLDVCMYMCTYIRGPCAGPCARDFVYNKRRKDNNARHKPTSSNPQRITVQTSTLRFCIVNNSILLILPENSNLPDEQNIW